MSDFQKDIEQIIKNNVATMTGNRQQRRSLHITHQQLDLLDELFGSDEDATVFVNHFGHVEYHNRAFGRIMMLDKQSNALTSIYDLEKLNIDFAQPDGTLGPVYLTYPNGSVLYMTFNHQLVDLQKCTLLQFKFKDITSIYHSGKALKDLQDNTDHYLNHLPSPMFLLNAEGEVIHVPNLTMNIFGRSGKELKGENIFESLPFDYASEIMDKIKNITEKTDGHFMYQTENDRIVKVYDTTVHMVDQGLYLCQISDVSDLNTMSSTIEYLNSYDSLTGFHNMNFYEDAIAGMKDSGHLPLGVYTLTLGGLKQVNVRLGYHQCDNLIIEIALNIKSLISQHEIPCRITGDTFVIFFPNVSKGTMEKFGKSMAAFIEKYRTDYREYHLSYVEKSILVTDGDTNIHDLMNGMIL